MYEQFEDTKWVIRSQRLQKKRENTMAPNKKKDQRTNNNLQNTTQKYKDRATRTPLKTGVNSELRTQNSELGNIEAVCNKMRNKIPHCRNSSKTQ